MYRETLPDMSTMRGVLRFYSVGEIDAVARAKEKISIKTLLIVGTVRCEIAVLRRAVSIDIFTILEEEIAVLEAHLWIYIEELTPLCEK
jgi:hypothetical protein